MRVNENILISSLTTMRLGGPTRYVLEAEHPSEVSDAFGFAKQYNLPTFTLGYGANTIGHDEGFKGAIIINRMQGISAETIGKYAFGDANDLAKALEEPYDFKALKEFRSKYIEVDEDCTKALSDFIIDIAK